MLHFSTQAGEAVSADSENDLEKTNNCIELALHCSATTHHSVLQ